MKRHPAQPFSGTSPAQVQQAETTPSSRQGVLLLPVEPATLPPAPTQAGRRGRSCTAHQLSGFWPRRVACALLLGLGLAASGLATILPQPASAQGNRPADPSSPSESARPLTGKPDRNVISAGETFNYVLTLADGQGRSPPDLTPLLDNFEVVDRRRSSRAEMENGRPVHLDQWVMTLLPKREGTLTIPPLTVAGQTAPPARVQVVPAAALDDINDAPLFVRVATGAGPAFAQSDIPVTIRIYDRIGMMRGAMEKPVAEGATFVPDGDQRHFLKTIKNRRYRVLEQSYLMRPQRSGTIEIQPLTLDATVAGAIPGNPGDRDTAALLGRGTFTGQLPPERNITVRSLPVKVEVQSRPADATGWFMPARQVMLHDEWSGPLNTVKVGQVLTRTLTLEAKGATPNQLPPLTITPVAGLRQYEDKAETETAWIDGQVGAQLRKVISVMATRPGTYTLPGIDVQWWNLDTGKQEITRLPAVTIEVEGDMPEMAVAASGMPAPPGSSATLPDAPPPTVADSNSPLLKEMLARTIAAATGAWHFAQAHLPVVVVGLIILVGLALWRRVARNRRRQKLAATPAHAPRLKAGALPHVNAPDAIIALEKACKANDAFAAHTAYLAWARDAADTAPAHHQATEAQLMPSLADLRAHLYGAAPGQWRGKPFLQAFTKARKPGRKSRRHGGGAVLAPLYPQDSKAVKSF